jgi:hypothetical protein
MPNWCLTWVCEVAQPLFERHRTEQRQDRDLFAVFSLFHKSRE